MTITLTPVTGSFGVVVELSKRSPHAADALARLALYEALDTEIDKVRPQLAVEVAKRMAEANKRARTALLRNHVAKSRAGQEPDDAEVARGLAVLDQYVEKGLLGWALNAFNQLHPRDEKGRFIEVNVQPRTATETRDVRDEGIAIRVGNQVKRWKDAKLVDADTPVVLQYRMMHPETSQPFGNEMTMDTTAGQAADRARQLMADNAGVPHGIAVERTNLKQIKDPRQLAAIDLLHMASGGDIDAAMARTLTRGLFDQTTGAPKNLTGAAQTWHTASRGGPEQDRQAYRRIGMIGGALTAASLPGSPGAAVGAMGQLVGTLGPEAEKVLGPGIRRAAYRYRGTERRPKETIRSTVKEANRAALLLSSPNETVRRNALDILHREGKPSKTGEPDPVAAIAATTANTTMTGDQRALQMRGDALVANMLGLTGDDSMLPDRELTNLSIASGEMPPSEGVMLDAEGRVVTQAVGYNGDHYLPFDLKNLNALHGGQYARTRTTGGPTGEDIYTGLLMGARQIQVVSNSGVFTLEFDPDLRGGRRYNDKAKRMIERYESMLAAINRKDSKLYTSDISEQEKNDIRTEVARGGITDRDEHKRISDARIEQERMKRSFRRETSGELMEGAENYASAKLAQELSRTGERPTKPEVERIKDEYREEFLDRHSPMVRKLKLDGEGYGRALAALKQEFPYYIRTASFQTLPDWIRSHGFRNVQGYIGAVGMHDVGYVEPGQTNIARAMEAGWRTRRQVPGGAVRAEAAAPAAVGAGLPQPLAATRTEGTRTAPATGEKSVDLEAEKKPGGAVHRRLRTVLGQLATLRSNLPPKGGPVHPESTEGEAMRDAKSPGAYAHFKASNWVDELGSAAGDAATTWLLNPETPRAQREKFLAGLSTLDEEAQGFEEYKDEAHGAQDNLSTLGEWLDALEPFASHKEGETGNFEAEPEGDDPKPQFLPEHVPALGSPPEEFARVATRYQNEPIPGLGTLAEEFGELKGKAPADQGAYVSAKLARLEHAKANEGPDEVAEHQKRVARAQIAWSFLRAQEANAKLHGLVRPSAGGGGGGAAPFAPPRQGEVRQRLDPLHQLVADLRADVRWLMEQP